MKLVIASNNNNKIREIKDILAPWYSNAVSMRDAGVTADVVEDGGTFEENSLKKAREIFDALGGRFAVLADDSGLSVDALCGAPGVYSARYAVEHDDAANNEKLLRELDGVPDEKRSARFVCVVTLVRPDGETLVARGESEGVIGRAARGVGGFGYDPLFFVPELNKTFAQLDPEEKNAISHRGRALLKLCGLLGGERP